MGVVTESFSAKTYKSIAPIGCPFILNGSTGTITVLSDQIQIYGEKVEGADNLLQITIEKADTFVEEIKHFIDCIKNGEVPITSGRKNGRR